MLDVLTAVDSNFTMQLGVLVASLAASQDMPIRLHVLQNEIDETARRKIEQCAGDALIDICWVTIPRRSLEGTNFTAHLTIAASYRLVGPDLISAEIESALYLDADLIVLHPLQPLAAALEGRTVAAARDGNAPWACSEPGLDWPTLGLAAADPLFNAGVLGIDLTRWRDGKIGARAIDLLRKHRFKYGDQDALNIVLRRDWTEVDPSWNLHGGLVRDIAALGPMVHSRDVLESARRQPKIVHYTNDQLGRPWLTGCSHPYRDEWITLLDATPWSGWRPRPPQFRQRLQTFTRQVGSATRRLVRPA